MTLPDSSGGSGPSLVGSLGYPADVSNKALSDDKGERRDPVSMAMHLHASFSEQSASYEAHLSEARRIGVDVLWWTDHDFRLSALGHREAVRFDEAAETEGDPRLVLEWVPEYDGDVEAADCSYVDEPHSPDEEGRAMRLRMRSKNAEPATFWCHARAAYRRYSTSLSSTTLELDVFPESLPKRSAFIVEIELSYHPAVAGRRAGKYRLQYRHGAFPRRRCYVESDPLLGVLEVPVSVGRWVRMSMNPVDDIAALWPDMVAADNVLNELRVGLRGEDGLDAYVVIDRLRFNRTEREGCDALKLRRRILDEYVTRFPDLRQYESLELSLVRHLNWYGDQLHLPDYGDNPPFRDDTVELAARMVELIHSHGGLASWNHPLDEMYGSSQAHDLAQVLLQTGALGADIVEVGHRNKLHEMLDVFDIAARNAIFFTANGASDDHHAEDWLTRKPNYVTSVWARSVGLPDLLDALRQGRGWFFDPSAWSGALDLHVDNLRAMGSAFISERLSLPIRVTATDLPSKSTLEIITGAVDLAGLNDLRPRVVTRAVPVRAVSGGECEVELRRRGAVGAYLRAQVRDEVGTVIGVGNPVWLFPKDTDIVIPAARRRVMS